MVMTNITTIQISKKTRERLESFGKKSETYDDVINRLFDERAFIDWDEYNRVKKKKEAKSG